MLRKTIYTDQINIKEDVSTLLVEAFPENERPSVDFFFENIKKDNNELIAFYDNDVFVGFAALAFYQDICYIFFLAVSPTKRHQGYGGQILETIKNDYQDYILLLAYEEVDSKYSNYLERVNREQFYIKHGFINNNLITDEWGVHFQTAYIGERKVTFEEYQEIFRICFGVDPKKHLKKAI